MIETYFEHTCSNCNDKLIFYHLNWLAVACKFCKYEIKIQDVKNANTEIVTTIYKNGNREKIN